MATVTLKNTPDEPKTYSVEDFPSTKFGVIVASPKRPYFLGTVIVIRGSYVVYLGDSVGHDLVECSYVRAYRIRELAPGEIIEIRG